MSKSVDNLKTAFAGESMANRRYLAFAKKADQAGFPQIARLFRAAAAAETIHAHAHLRALGGVKSTVENLRAAISGEKHEFEAMYPDFIATAEAEGEAVAALSMKRAMEVEKVHHGLFTDALAAVEAGHDLAAGAIHVCDVCGHTVIGDVPDSCPVCKAGASRFKEVV